jgi:hypothetical protein
MSSCNISYLSTGVDLSVLQLLKTNTDEIFFFVQVLQEQVSKLKWFEKLSPRRGSGSKITRVEFFSIDEDNKVSWNAQVKFIPFHEPKLIVGQNDKDNRPIEFDITSEWNDNGSKQLVQQNRPHFFDKRVSRLKEYLIRIINIERADIITERLKAKTNAEAIGAWEPG